MPGKYYEDLEVVLKHTQGRSRPDQGIVRFRHIGNNQDGVVVIEVERTALILKRPETLADSP
jgi:acyl dehydratase